MGMVKETLQGIIERLAWELADHTSMGPEYGLCRDYEARLWEVAMRRPGTFERLCERYMVANPFAV